MGNNSAQNTCSTHLTQNKVGPASIDQEDGHLTMSERSSATSNSAHRPATHVLPDAVREASAALSLPGERAGAPISKRCIPLFASIVQCPGRKPGHVCVSVPVSGFFGVCAVGHTQLPTSSTVFRRFVKGFSPP